MCTYMRAWPNLIILSHDHFLLSRYMTMRSVVVDLEFCFQGAKRVFIVLFN